MEFPSQSFDSMAVNGGNSSFSSGFDFSPEELQVGEILLQLPYLIVKSEFSLGLPLSWGRKRKRSVLNPSSPPLPLSSSSMAPPLTEIEGQISKKASLSPTTPLSLQSESDESTKRLKKTKLFKKNDKKELLESIDELTERKKLLERELENVKRYFDEQKSYNLELRAKKQQMILSFKKDSIQSQPESGASNQPKETPESTVKSAIFETQELNHYPSINDQTATSAESSHSFKFEKVASYDNTEPIGIPDLNVSLEELTHRSYNRFMAAQARQRRMQICKTKSSNAASKLQSANPCR